MSEPKRDDLRVQILCPHRGTLDPTGRKIDGTKSHPMGEATGFNRGGATTYAGYCPGPTDADLAAMGYVKLDAIEVEALREACEGGMWPESEREFFEDFARQVLAALDGAVRCRACGSTTSDVGFTDGTCNECALDGETP